jgi:single-strand DNA-binding protein
VPTPTTTEPDAEDGVPTDLNEVVLEGRLSAEPDVKELPSGGQLVLLRVVARRPDGRRVDSLPVVVGPAPGRGQRRAPGQPSARDVRRAAGLAVDDRVRVVGRLQRHFWDAGGARRSRLQVVAETVERRR